MVEVQVKDGVHKWLGAIYKNGIKKVNPDKEFRHYKPLDIGNRKLHKGIFSFSLLPVVTCGGIACKGCYDLRSLRHKSVRRKRYVNTSLATHDLERLEDLIIKQVEGAKTIKYLRIHVGGDMFNEEYVNMWRRLAYRFKITKPTLKLYTYTKTKYAETLKESGINVVRSEYEEGHNYGSMEYILGLKTKYSGKICPATLTKSTTKICGDKCKLCMNLTNVLFKIH